MPATQLSPKSEVHLGLTVVIDRLSGLIRDEFREIAKFVDVIEFGWGLPFVWREEALRSRIRYYQHLGLKVCMSGTLLEYSKLHGSVPALLAEAESLGFNMMEVSDGIIDMNFYEKESLAKAVKSHGFDFLYTVGKKDPAAQMTLDETLKQIEAGLALRPFKVAIESRERGVGVGIYDEEGGIRWNVLRAITSKFDRDDLIFEAPLELQQAALILEIGPDVNLGRIPLGAVATLQSKRLGLRFDTFGIDRPREGLKAGPATKFVLFAIRNYQPIDPRGIASVTELPRRTIQKALGYLLSHKLVTEHPSLEDGRTRIYRTPSTSPFYRKRQPVR